MFQLKKNQEQTFYKKSHFLMKCFKGKRKIQISINVDLKMNSFKFDNLGIFSHNSFKSIALDFLFFGLSKWQNFPFLFNLINLAMYIKLCYPYSYSYEGRLNRRW